MKVWLGFPPERVSSAAPVESTVTVATAITPHSSRGWPIALTTRAASPRRSDAAPIYLDPKQVADLFGEFAPALPRAIAERLEAPRVDPRWWTRPAPASVATLRGKDRWESGAPPWLLQSPVSLSAPVPPALAGFLQDVPTNEPWRAGYYPVLADNKQSLGAFLALLPPDFDAASPAKSIQRIVLMFGSGDNRARSALSELAGFAAPGTLFVSFDMQALSIGQKTPESPGLPALTQGFDYIRRTLGLADGIPQYLAGFSAGGAATLVQAFQAFPGIKGAAALSPVIMKWNIHAPDASQPGSDQFAKTAANGTAPIERTYAVASEVARGYFTADEYAAMSPHHRLARGEMPKVPLLVTGGTTDLLAQPVVASTAEIASFNAGLTLPVVYGSDDAQAGKTIDIEGYARALAKTPGLAVVTLTGVDHRLRSELKRPDGKPWTIDMRDLMMRFFKELERASAP